MTPKDKLAVEFFIKVVIAFWAVSTLAQWFGEHVL
jgi:hypothetical protein